MDLRADQIPLEKLKGSETSFKGSFLSKEHVVVLKVKKVHTTESPKFYLRAIIRLFPVKRAEQAE